MKTFGETPILLFSSYRPLVANSWIETSGEVKFPRPQDVGLLRRRSRSLRPTRSVGIALRAIRPPTLRRAWEKQHMTATQFLLTAAIGMVVGILGGFDVGYALGREDGRRAK